MELPKVAVIGVGPMGLQHARVVAASKRAELGVVVDADPDRAAAASARFGCKGAKHFAAALLCDAAVVATSTEHHVEVAGELLAAGIPLLVEKPLSFDLDQTVGLVEAARSSGVAFTCGFVERHNPAVATVAEQIQGPLRHVLAIRHSPAPERPKGSVVWDLLVHDLDLVLGLAGGTEPVTVVATAEWLDGVDEAADVLLAFPDGLRASLSVSRRAQRKVRTWHLSGTDVSIELDLMRQDVTCYRHRDHGAGAGLAYRAETVVDIPFVRHGGEPLELQFHHFLDLVGGLADPVVELDRVVPAHRLAATVQAAFAVRGATSAADERASIPAR